MHTCACVSGTTHLRVVGAEPMCRSPRKCRWGARARLAGREGSYYPPLYFFLLEVPRPLYSSHVHLESSFG